MNPVPAGQPLELRDIHAPPAPDLWPPAPGWWGLVVLGLALLGLGFWRLARGLRIRRRRRRRRRRILAELARLEAGLRGPALAAEVSALLKRVALDRFPRADVAPLTGADWLAFLDRTGGRGRFTAGPGTVLEDGLYAPAADFDAHALLSLARDWVRSNT